MVNPYQAARAAADSARAFRSAGPAPSAVPHALAVFSEQVLERRVVEHGFGEASPWVGGSHPTAPLAGLHPASPCRLVQSLEERTVSDRHGLLLRSARKHSGYPNVKWDYTKSRDHLSLALQNSTSRLEGAVSVPAYSSSPSRRSG